jgi:CheY-like chemotaxis protein/anti-sigma regulatory factor (Ser/Thr protein kinase)
VELRREQIDLRTVLQSAIEAARPFIDAQNHTLVADLPPAPVCVDGDPVRLAQVFSNLLNNAAKFTERDGRIRVALDSEGGKARVTISDNGIGIPSAMIPRVFDMFRQLQQFRDRTHGGLGIGLTLARRLVELHGGTIDARSDGPGRGSTFVITIATIAPSVDHTRRGRDQVEAPAHGCRVLVAEDDSDSAEMMRLVLEITGNDVRVAQDGEAAVRIAETFEPQIAFIDIGMPRVDGYETARRMRRVFGERVVLVALTGLGQDEDKRRSHEAGFDHHLTKPPDPDVIEGLIADCVKRQSA